MAIALGTYFGGWRIVHTMGSKITKLKPVGGFCAETAGAITLFGTALAGIPVSTTHTITGAIIGVGTTHRLSAVRWGVATPHRVGLDSDHSRIGGGGHAGLLADPVVQPHRVRRPLHHCSRSSPSRSCISQRQDCHPERDFSPSRRPACGRRNSWFAVWRIREQRTTAFPAFTAKISRAIMPPIPHSAMLKPRWRRSAPAA